MTEAARGQGVQLQVSPFESGSVDGDYVTIAEMRDITVTGQSDELDASNHDTPDAYKEFVAGMKGMEIRASGNHLPNNASQDGNTGLLDWWIQGDRRQFRLRYSQFSPKTQMTGVAVCLEYSPNSPSQQLATISTRLRVNGAPAFSTYS